MKRSLKTFLFLCLCLISNIGFTNTEKEDFKEALRLYKNKKYSESLVLWDKLSKTSPNKSIYRFNKANVLLSSKQYEKAIQEYQSIIDNKNSLSHFSKLYQAICFRKLKKYDLAQKSLNEMQNLQIPKVLRKSILEEQEKLSNQINGIYEVNDIPYQYPLGLKFFKQQFYKQAAQNLEQAAKEIQTSELFLIKGIAHLKLDNIEQSLKDFEVAMSLTNNPEFRNNIKEVTALIYKRQGLSSTPWIFSFDSSINFNQMPFISGQVDSTSKDTEFSNILEVGRKVFEREDYELDIAYTASFDETFKDVDDRLLEHFIEIDQSISYQSWSLRLSPGYVFIKEGNKNKVGRPQVKGEITKRNSSVRYGIDYTYANVVSQKSEFDLLDGKSESTKIFFGQTGKKYDVELGLITIKEDRTDSAIVVNSNTGFGALFSLTMFVRDRITFLTILNFLKQNYETVPETHFARKDKSSSVILGLQYGINENFSTYLNTSLSFIDSNLNSSQEEASSLVRDQFNFQESVSIGLNWSL